MKKETGVSAFPMSKVTVLAEDGTPNEYAEVGQLGMTLRDYFAAKAMQALVSETHTDAVILAMAMTAYDYADAMLKAREA